MFLSISLLESICRTSFPHFDDHAELLNYLLEIGIRDEPERRSVAVPLQTNVDVEYADRTSQANLPSGRSFPPLFTLLCHQPRRIYECSSQP